MPAEKCSKSDGICVKSGLNLPYLAATRGRQMSWKADCVPGGLARNRPGSLRPDSRPQCLQRAHECAALVDFDLQVLEDQICQALRRRLGEKKWVVDELALQAADPAGARYA